jgi:hypothetical protein
MDAADAVSGQWPLKCMATEHSTVHGVRPIEYAIICGHAQAVESLGRQRPSVGNHQDCVKNLIQLAIDIRQWGVLTALLNHDAPMPRRIKLQCPQVHRPLTQVAKQTNNDAFTHLVFHSVVFSSSALIGGAPLDHEPCFCAECSHKGLQSDDVVS